MKANEIVSDDARPVETDDLFETANLFPRTTGLPMTVWVSPRGNARRDVRIKVNMSHGDQMSPANTASGRRRELLRVVFRPMTGRRSLNGCR